jgi:carboxymethylenebutenolidase
MHQRLIFGLFSFLLGLQAALATAQDWAREKVEKSPRHGEWVELNHGDRKVDAFIMYPEVAEKATAIVIVHEIFGLTDWVRGVADDLSAAGYIAICPDLLSGSGPDGGNTESFKNVEAARRAIGSLPPDQITADLNAAAEYVSKLPAANGKVAVMGFCWGGSQTFRFATNNPNIIAAIPFYGSGPTEEKDIARIEAPVYGFYGSNDARVNATISDSEKQMKAAKKKYEVTIYEGAGHGFLRMGESPDATVANKTARKQAMERVVELLKIATSKAEKKNEPGKDH